MISTCQPVIIGLGEMAVTKNNTTVLACVGLGSCISLCVYDPIPRIGGMAHMLLPTCNKKRDEYTAPSKYVDSGTHALIQKMLNLGAIKSRIVIKAVGGARMLSIPGSNSILDIGQRNIHELRATLEREVMNIYRSDLGGTSGRSVHFYLDTGKVTVKTVDAKVIEL